MLESNEPQADLLSCQRPDMSFMKRLESIVRPWAIPNITGKIIIGQVVLFVLHMVSDAQGGAMAFDKLYLNPSKVLAGEIWRVFTFPLVPFFLEPISAFFGWLIFYMFGSALEREWGTVRYNVFLIVGYFANVAASFATLAVPGDYTAENGFFYATVFLAFAHINPNFVINLMLILPIRIKWLALIMWIGYAFGLIRGDWMDRFLIVASLANYFVFFGKDHWQQIKSGQRRRAYQAKTREAAQSLVHECVVCGLDSESAPRTLFRYCSKCAGQRCYCPDHIHNHEHVVEDNESSTEPEVTSSEQV